MWVSLVPIYLKAQDSIYFVRWGICIFISQPVHSEYAAFHKHLSGHSPESLSQEGVIKSLSQEGVITPRLWVTQNLFSCLHYPGLLFGCCHFLPIISCVHNKWCLPNGHLWVQLDTCAFRQVAST